jgi:putative membrane protein
MRKTTVGLVGLALGLMLLGHSYSARGGGVVKITNDEEFLAHAVAQGILEVKLSEEAAKRATNAQVKQFAQKMVTEHEKCNKRLLTLASERKLAVVAGLNQDAKDRLGRITRLEGAAFDRAYMQEQVKMHERAIEQFEKRARATESAPIKTFINDTLPHLREHLKEAREISAKVSSR